MLLFRPGSSSTIQAPPMQAACGETRKLSIIFFPVNSGLRYQRPGTREPITTLVVLWSLMIIKKGDQNNGAGINRMVSIGSSSEVLNVQCSSWQKVDLKSEQGYLIMIYINDSHLSFIEMCSDNSTLHCSVTTTACDFFPPGMWEFVWYYTDCPSVLPFGVTWSYHEIISRYDHVTPNGSTEGQSVKRVDSSASKSPVKHDSDRMPPWLHMSWLWDQTVRRPIVSKQRQTQRVRSCTDHHTFSFTSRNEHLITSCACTPNNRDRPCAHPITVTGRACTQWPWQAKTELQSVRGGWQPSTYATRIPATNMVGVWNRCILGFVKLVCCMEVYSFVWTMACHRAWLHHWARFETMWMLTAAEAQVLTLPQLTAACSL